MKICPLPWSKIPQGFIFSVTRQAPAAPAQQEVPPQVPPEVPPEVESEPGPRSERACSWDLFLRAWHCITLLVGGDWNIFYIPICWEYRPN